MGGAKGGFWQENGTVGFFKLLREAGRPVKPRVVPGRCVGLRPVKKLHHKSRKVKLSEAKAPRWQWKVSFFPRKKTNFKRAVRKGRRNHQSVSNLASGT